MTAKIFGLEHAAFLNGLTSNLRELTRRMVVNEELIASMMQDGVLSDSMKDRINSKNTRAGMVSELLDLIKRTNPYKTRDSFLRALILTDQKDLAILVDELNARKLIEELLPFESTATVDKKTTEATLDDLFAN